MKNEDQLKALLEKSNDVVTSDKFTSDLMNRIDVYETQKQKLPNYLRVTILLFIIVVIISPFVLSYFTSLACRFASTYCNYLQYIITGVFALLILGQLSFLLSRLNEFKNTVTT